MTELQMDANGLQSDIERLVRRFENKYVGRRVEIIVNFRDQPFGRSKPDLRGKEYVIERVSADTFGVSLALAGVRMMIHPEEVRVL